MPMVVSHYLISFLSASCIPSKRYFSEGFTETVHANAFIQCCTFLLQLLTLKYYTSVALYIASFIKQINVMIYYGTIHFLGHLNEIGSNRKYRSR